VLVVPIFVAMWIVVVAVAITIEVASVRAGMNPLLMIGLPAAAIGFAWLELDGIRRGEGVVPVEGWFLASLLLLALLGIGIAMWRYQRSGASDGGAGE